MAIQKLTKRLIDSTNPEQGKRAYLWDTEVTGFGVRCIGGGSKIFLLKREILGRQSWIRVGAFGSELTLEQAREIARAKSGDLAKGMDLAKARDDRKKAPKVEDLVIRFLREQSPRLKERTFEEYKRQFKTIILPAIGKHRVASVTATDIGQIHYELRATPILSNRVHALLSRMFNLAERWSMRPRGTNPCFGHDKFHEQSRERFLSDDELQRLGDALDAADASLSENVVATNAIRFLLFSGWRLNEAVRLKWSSVDSKAGIIRLDDTKGGAATIDVNPAMASVLGTMKNHQVLKNPYVFPGREKGSCLANLRNNWLRLCKLAGIEGVRLHDLRRTFGTVGAGDAGLTHETIGKVLRHKQTSTTAIYARLASSVRKVASEKIGEAMLNKLQGAKTS